MTKTSLLRHMTWLVLGLTLAGAACGSGAVTPTPETEGGGSMAFSLTSDAFAGGENIPTRYTCDGADVSPALSWSDVPDGTESLALIMDDPDAPGRTFTHWVLFDIPASQRSLAEGFAPGDVGTSGQSSFRRVGYGGPCPPGGSPHRYFFTLYALDVDSLGLSRGASLSDVEDAMEGHVLGEVQLMGRYARQ